MLLPVFQDLIKPQWRLVIEALKLNGGMPVAELSRRTGTSYMTAKTHCEELVQAGYLIRTRLPRSGIGRPEILYSLSDKADVLFPEAGVTFTLEVLSILAKLHGETTPEKLLYQLFQRRFETYAPALDPLPTIPAKAARLQSLRLKEGIASSLEKAEQTLRLVEAHHPMQRIFDRYPRAAAMECQMISQLLGTRVTRHELPAGREGMPRVVFEILQARPPDLTA